MTLLNDEEKVTFLIDLLDRHIDKLRSENSFVNYLESIRVFLKTKDPILQKTAISGNGLEASVAGSKDTYRSSALAHPNHLSAIQMGGSIPPALL